MHRVLPRNQGGLSLIELVMVFVVLSVALGAGLPSLQSLVAGNRMSTARSGLTLAFAQARAEAVVRASNVVVCPGNGDGGCADTIHWQRGWISFEDGNRNGLRDAGEPQLGAGGVPPGVAVATSNGRRSVRYLADGTSEGSNVTLTFCDRRGASRASALALNNAGRLRRVAVDPGYAATACGAVE
ncbi:GspH/FimT family pseudopilin [Tahibacter soli]|uniref:Type II secretion system protein H n=1 Tax=Tahibacter soli TaxID=2983605 RepID=A0A9X3YHY6_9GAMM|nr:GspH/FimT family pseudopilin [Tahibacter soli]MDC8011987.1 GspH/FimT family pseudopilin [Tahibacter soli]